MSLSAKLLRENPHWFRGEWTTDYEADYIRHIGVFKARYVEKAEKQYAFVDSILRGERTGAYAGIYLKRRIRLLEGYLRAAANRSDWGAIDKDVAMSFAQAELEAAKKLLVGRE